MRAESRLCARAKGVPYSATGKTGRGRMRVPGAAARGRGDACATGQRATGRARATCTRAWRRRERGGTGQRWTSYISFGAAHSQTASMDSQSSPGRRPLPETSSRPAQPRPLSVKPQSSPELTQSAASSSDCPIPVPRSSQQRQRQSSAHLRFPHLTRNLVFSALPLPFATPAILRCWSSPPPSSPRFKSSRPGSGSMMREKSKGNDWLAEVTYHGPDPDRPIPVPRPLPANPRPRLVADLRRRRLRPRLSSSVVCCGENHGDGVRGDSMLRRQGLYTHAAAPSCLRRLLP